MKNILKSETFLGITASIVFSLILFFAFLWATAPEQWYADMHDSQCEATMANEGEGCGCYERLVAGDKARYNN